MKKMKIVAGLGSADDYLDYAAAGADELFAGYVPPEWQCVQGHAALNRREVSCSNVQLGSESELELLQALVKKTGVPVTLAFNGIHIRPDEAREVTKILQRCAQLGYRSFIVAQPPLFLWVREHPLPEECSLQVSGEFGEMNRIVWRYLARNGAKRLIFRRGLSTAEMAGLIRSVPEEREYEAFVLNEKCHFTGAFCNSLHCDELPPMCREPYHLAGYDDSSRTLPSPAAAQRDTDCELGKGGCGMCALWRLRESGVTHLKVVGRGAGSDDMLRDIRSLKSALCILEDSHSEEEYLRRMRVSLFPDGCSGNCYYSI